MPRSFSETLDQIAAFAAADPNQTSLEFLNELSLDDIAQLVTYIGTLEPYMPQGFMDDVDRGTTEWSNQITDYQQRFERVVFRAAVQHQDPGRELLFILIFEPPEHEVDYMHWQYACIGAMETLAADVATLHDPEPWLQRLTETLEQVSDLRMGLVVGLMTGLKNLRASPSRETLERLERLVRRAEARGHGGLSWQFAMAFADLVPDLARGIAQMVLDGLSPVGHEARHEGDLQSFLELHRFFPNDPKIIRSLHRTADTWLNNEYFDGALYVIVSIWNDRRLGPFRQAVSVHKDRLERITQGLPPMPSVEPVEVDSLAILRAHLLLVHISEDPGPHRAYVEEQTAGFKRQERDWLAQWMEG